MDLQSILLATPLNYMTEVALDPYQRSVVVATDEKGRIETGDLESRLVRAGYPKHARREAIKGVDSLNYLNSHLERLEKEGSLKEQRDYFRAIGYNSSYPESYKVAVTGPKGVVAFTDGKLLGVTTDFRRQLRMVARHAQVSEERAAEYIIFHENGHKAQPSYIRASTTSAEQDTESKAYDYFSRKARAQKDISKRRDYERLANYAYKRMHSVAKNYKKAA